MARLAVGCVVAGLIYPASAGGFPALVRLLPNEAYAGVVVGGATPRLHDVTFNATVFTITGGAVTPSAAPGPGIHTDSRIVTLNPSVLGDDVVLCAGGIFANATPPVWCRYTAVSASADCPVGAAGCVEAGGLRIDSHKIWAWSANKSRLVAYETPDPAAPAATVMVAAAAMVVLESSSGGDVPMKLVWDSVLFAVTAGVFAGCGWQAAVVLGVGVAAAAGVSFGALPRRQAADAAAAALAVVISEALPVWVIGHEAVGIVQAALALGVAAAAGRRGSLWGLPWAAMVIIEPVVVSSGAVSAARRAESELVAGLVVASAALLGFATTDLSRETWWGHFRLLPTKRSHV